MSSAGHIFDMIRRIDTNRKYLTDKKYKRQEKNMSLKPNNFITEDKQIFYQDSKWLKVVNVILLLILIVLLMYIIVASLLK